MSDDTRPQHPPQWVYVVDDDEAMRDSLAWLLESVGLPVRSFANAAACLAALEQADGARGEIPGSGSDTGSQPQAPSAEACGCLITDVRMPGMSGLNLQRNLARQHPAIPVVVITGHGDVPMAVTAMKQGAWDFIEKPFHDQTLLDCVQRALQHHRQRHQAHAHERRIRQRYAALTPREREVMDQVVAGHANKDIAEQLGLSRKTVEVHRARVMDKMQADSLAALVRMALVAAGD